MISFETLSNIDILFFDQNTIGIDFDFSKCVEKTVAHFDLLLSEKVSAIKCVGKNNCAVLRVTSNENELKVGKEIEFTVNQQTLELVKDGLLNVLIHEGFSGYHLDIDVQIEGGRPRYLLQCNESKQICLKSFFCR